MLLCRAYAIRDYYPFWKSRNERSRAGKLLLLDPADEDVIQIFFDDNIGHGSANIVDVRDVRSGEPLAFQVGNDCRETCSNIYRHPLAQESLLQGLATAHQDILGGLFLCMVCKVLEQTGLCLALT